jgi:hypothetical protein
MRPRGLGLLLGALVLLTACAALPTGPGVLVLPGAGTAVEAFQRDDRECQGYASHQLPTGAPAAASSAATLQWRYDMAYVQCMYAKGHRVPDGSVPPPPPQPVPSPPPPGAPRSSAGPMEPPTAFERAMNLKTARALRTLPPIPPPPGG